MNIHKLLTNADKLQLTGLCRFGSVCNSMDTFDLKRNWRSLFLKQANIEVSCKYKNLNSEKKITCGSYGSPYMIQVQFYSHSYLLTNLITSC